MKRVGFHVKVLTLCGIAALAVGCSSPNLPQGENGTTAGGSGNFGANPQQPGDYQNSNMQGQGSPPNTANPNEYSPAPLPQPGSGGSK